MVISYSIFKFCRCGYRNGYWIPVNCYMEIRVLILSVQHSTRSSQKLTVQQNQHVDSLRSSILQSFIDCQTINTLIFIYPYTGVQHRYDIVTASDTINTLYLIIQFTRIQHRYSIVDDYFRYFY